MFKNIIKKASQFKKQWRKNRLRKRILRYYDQQIKAGNQSPLVQTLAYYNNSDLVVFPYSYTARYKAAQISVFREDGFPYVLLNHKKLFFRSNWSDKKTANYHNGLLMEQDPESPHCYLTDSFKVSEEETLIDIGAAEGNFSLDMAEVAKKIMLFETDPAWKEPLQKTFAPFNNKVSVYAKLVGDQSTEDMVQLDDFPELLHEKLFIKIDVEGWERKVLKGMSSLLEKNPNIRLVICTYHNNADAAEFEEFFQSKGFTTEFSKGYMLFYYDKKISSPFLRKGVLRVYR